MELTLKSIEANVFVKSGFDLRNAEAMAKLYSALREDFPTVSEVPGTGIAFRGPKESVYVQRGRFEVSWKKIDSPSDVLPFVESLVPRILTAFSISIEPEAIGFDTEYQLSVGQRPNMSRLVGVKGTPPLIVPTFLGGMMKRDGESVAVAINGAGTNYRLSLMKVADWSDRGKLDPTLSRDAEYLGQYIAKIDEVEI